MSIPRILRRFLPVVMGLIAVPWLGAQADDPIRPYEVQVWRAETGLPHNFVHCLIQTHDGYIWGGTQKGLARFDGVRFTVFNRANTPPMPHDAITALWESKDHTLWVGTDEGGIFCRRREGFSSPLIEAPPGHAITSFAETREGKVWIGTLNGLFCWEGGRVCRAGIPELDRAMIRSMISDAAGHLWLATEGGLRHVQQGKLADFKVPSEFSEIRIRAIQRVAGGEISFTMEGGLATLRGDGRTDAYRILPKNDHEPVALCSMRSGEYWIATAGNLRRFSHGHFRDVTDIRPPFDLITALLEDHEGNVWVASRGGLYRLNESGRSFFTPRQGLGHKNVISVGEDRTGAIWAATWGGGFHVLRQARFEPMPIGDGLPERLALSLYPGSDGSVWGGFDYDGGLARWKDGKWTRLALPGLKHGITAISEDRRGTIWVGTKAGLHSWTPGQPALPPEPSVLAGKSVSAIQEDAEGRLWIGTRNGLARLSQGAIQMVAGKGWTQAAITGLSQAQSGGVWIATAESGLGRFRQNEWTRYTANDGLLSDEIFDVAEDGRGSLWMVGARGVFRVTLQNLDEFDAGKAKSLVSITPGGILPLQASRGGKPGLWAAKDGRIWVPTHQGLLAIDPASFNQAPPPIQIEQLKAGRESIPWSASVELAPAGRDNLEFHYTALSFRSPEANRFKYRLEGQEANWIDAGSRRVAYFNHLPPGRYTFHVTGCNNDGIWNETGAKMAFRIQPYFWETWWFSTLAALIVLGLVGGTARHFARRKLRIRLEQLRQQNLLEQERRRIAQDMHDDVGSGLTEILMLTSLAANHPPGEPQTKVYAAKMAGVAENLVRNLDAIVWAVNPKNDSVENLALYLFEYVQRFLGSTGLSYSWDAPDELPDIPLAAETRHNFFLVCKEALNNVVKHSGATHVHLSLKLTGAGLYLYIADNGRGFTPGTGEVLGNGLLNMETRLRHVCGRFQLESAPGKGTRIEIEIPLQNS